MKQAVHIVVRSVMLRTVLTLSWSIRLAPSDAAAILLLRVLLLRTGATSKVLNSEVSAY
jgi:hypothetical protein